LQEVLARVGRYVEDYGDRMSVVIGVERYTQTQQKGAVRRLVSEVAWTRVKGDWLGYRDVYEVDGKTISNRTDRLRTLFADSPGTAIEQGRRIADESARYNLGRILRNFNTPTTALFFMQSSTQPRFRFARSASEVKEGMRHFRIAYEEVQRPTIIRTSRGNDMPLKGVILVRVDDGAILETEMRLQSRRATFRPDSIVQQDEKIGRPWAVAGIPVNTGEMVHTPTTVRIVVAYRLAPDLELLLPAEMRESYSGVEFESVRGSRSAEVATTIECVAEYSEYKRFETAGRMVAPKQMDRDVPMAQIHWE
jgi:hypothetical protein